MSEPLKFPANIPLVGQPFALKSWYATVNIICNCEAKESVLIVGLGSVAQCPACKRGFAIGQIQFNGQTGQNQIGIGIVSTREEKAPS